MLRHVTLCSATPEDVVLCDASPCNTMPCSVPPCNIVLHGATLCGVSSGDTTQLYTTLGSVALLGVLLSDSAL